MMLDSGTPLLTNNDIALTAEFPVTEKNSSKWKYFYRYVKLQKVDLNLKLKLGRATELGD